MAHVKLMDQARNTYEMFVGKHFENKEFAAGKKKDNYSHPNTSWCPVNRVLIQLTFFCDKFS